MEKLSNQTSENQNEFEEEVKTQYRAILDFLNKYDFNVTPAESTLIRKEIIDCIEENNKSKENFLKSRKRNLDYLQLQKEVFYRFFLHYYGINIQEYFDFTKKEYHGDALKDLFKYIQKKLRKDKELI